jgi:hypothetical protein
MSIMRCDGNLRCNPGLSADYAIADIPADGRPQPGEGAASIQTCCCSPVSCERTHSHSLSRRMNTSLTHSSDTNGAPWNSPSLVPRADAVGIYALDVDLHRHMHQLIGVDKL